LCRFEGDGCCFHGMDFGLMPDNLSRFGLQVTYATTNVTCQINIYTLQAESRTSL
jgi:hypothetical protein